MVLLIALYPVGLAVLLTSRRLSMRRRVAGALLCLPLAAVAVVAMLTPFWDFAGGLQLSGFRIDLDRIRQYDRLERHRASQQSESPAAAASLKSHVNVQWTDFRGPRRDGVVRNAGIALDWTAHPPREIYRQPVGEGYASFVVRGRRAYTLEQRRDNEAVVCYDWTDGRELWKHQYPARFEETLGGDGPRATPTLAGDRVVALGAAGHLRCLDAGTGDLLWSANVLEQTGADNLSWGLSGAPLVLDGRVYVTSSGTTRPSVLAYELESGKLAWRCRAGLQSYSSLMIAELAGRRQILNMAGEALNAIDPDSGDLLWSFPWITEYDINVAQPLLLPDNRIFISSGYGHGCAVLRVRQDDGRPDVRQLWANIRMKNKFSTSVHRDGYLYGLDERILACLDAESGERQWKAGRYNYGSLLLVDDHLLVLGERGELALVRAVPDAHHEVGRVQIFDDRTWNHFVVIDGMLLARNHKQMVLYDLRPPDGDT